MIKGNLKSKYNAKQNLIYLKQILNLFNLILNILLCKGTVAKEWGLGGSLFKYSAKSLPFNFTFDINKYKDLVLKFQNLINEGPNHLWCNPMTKPQILALV